MVVVGGRRSHLPTLPVSVSPGAAEPHREKKKSNCFGLTSFLADELVKIDASDVVTVSRAAARGPAEPPVGTGHGQRVSAASPRWGGASVLPPRGAISSRRVPMREFRFFIVLIKKKKNTQRRVFYFFFRAILELTL